MKQLQLKQKKVLLPLIPVFLLILYVILLLATGKNLPPSPLSRLFGPTKFKMQPENEKSKTPERTSPPVRYDPDSSARLLTKLENRAPLSDQDKSAENSLVGTINRKPLDLYTSDDYDVQFIEAVDTFMVEIKTTNIGKAKREAKSWFLSRGFTERGICDKPVIFYLNWEISLQLQNLNITFSPVAEGC